MNDVKQVLVVRRDLQMRRGKEGAQLGHSAMAFLVDRIKKVVDGFWPNNYTPTIAEILQLDLDQLHWIIGGMSSKIVLQAKDEAELLEVDRLCREAKLEVFLIQDVGLTATAAGRQGMATYTALGIGPNVVSEIDAITGPQGLHPLKLY